MKRLLSFGWPLAFAAVSTALLSAIYWLGWSIHPNSQAQELGQLGDFFGGLLNPLVSALTLFVAISVWRLQKEELVLTRSEMAQTKVAMEDQAKTAEQQRREQRFFDLMTLLQRVEDSIVSSDGHSNGKRAIRSYRYELGKPFRQTCQHGLGQIVEGVSITELVLQRHWNERAQKSPLISYLRVMSRILSDAEVILGKSRYQYIKLLQAQLSDDELGVIAIAIWLDPTWVKLKELVCEYGLLEGLSEPGLKQELQKILPNRAFGEYSATVSSDNL